MYQALSVRACSTIFARVFHWIGEQHCNRVPAVQACVAFQASAAQVCTLWCALVPTALLRLHRSTLAQTTQSV